MKFVGVFMLTQIPIAIAEGLLTVVAYNLISANFPFQEGGILNNGKNKSKTSLNIILLVAVAILMIGALLINKNGEFGGSDGEAESVITEIDPDYTPWFDSLLEPKSGEIESLLFTLQGSLGVGIITYILGYYKGKKKNAVN